MSGLGQSLSLKASTFNSGPRFFMSTHYITTPCITKRMPFHIDFGCFFISTPVYMGGGSKINDDGNVVNFTIDMDMMLTKSKGLYESADGFFNATTNATTGIGTFTGDTTFCITFVGNGTY